MLVKMDKLDEKIIEEAFRKLGISTAQLPKKSYSKDDYMNGFQQASMYQKPGKITTTASVNA